MERQDYLIRLNRAINVIGILSVSGVLAIVWFFGLKSARQACAEFQSQHTQHKQFLTTGTSLLNEYQVCTATLAQQRSETENLLTRIPRESREADFLDLLSDTAEQTGVMLQNFRPLPGPQAEHIRTSQIRISGRGSYHNLIAFLDQLRQMPRMNRVTRLEVGVADSTREICTIELTLELFFNLQPFGRETAAS